jgi:hypothetical protein
MSAANQKEPKAFQQQTCDDEPGPKRHLRQQAQGGQRNDPAGNQQTQACKLHEDCPGKDDAIIRESMVDLCDDPHGAAGQPTEKRPGMNRGVSVLAFAPQARLPQWQIAQNWFQRNWL